MRRKIEGERRTSCADGEREVELHFLCTPSMPVEMPGLEACASVKSGGVCCGVICDENMSCDGTSATVVKVRIGGMKLLLYCCGYV